MRYPFSGMYRNCPVCGRVFHVEPSELRRRANMFCTRSCFHKSLRAFSRALASGQLEQILGLPVIREWLAEDTKPTHRYGEVSHKRALRGDRNGGWNAEGTESAYQRQLRELGAPLEE